MSVIYNILFNSITAGLVIVVIFCVTFLLKKRSGIKHLKYIWILIAANMFLPFGQLILPYTYIIEMKDYILCRSDFEIPIRDVLFILWMFITVILLVYYGLGYVRMYRKSIRWSKKNDYKLVDELAKITANNIGLKNIPEIRIMDKSTRGPFTTGIIKNIIYLSKEKMEQNDLKYILKHEMMHCRNKDIIQMITLSFRIVRVIMFP